MHAQIYQCMYICHVYARECVAACIWEYKCVHVCLCANACACLCVAACRCAWKRLQLPMHGCACTSLRARVRVHESTFARLRARVCVREYAQATVRGRVWVYQCAFQKFVEGGVSVVPRALIFVPEFRGNLSIKLLRYQTRQNSSIFDHFWVGRSP